MSVNTTVATVRPVLPAGGAGATSVSTVRARAPRRMVMSYRSDATSQSGVCQLTAPPTALKCWSSRDRPAAPPLTWTLAATPAGRWNVASFTPPENWMGTSPAGRGSVTTIRVAPSWPSRAWSLIPPRSAVSPVSLPRDSIPHATDPFNVMVERYGRRRL
jgi:hypothetical protein